MTGTPPSFVTPPPITRFPYERRRVSPEAEEAYESMTLQDGTIEKAMNLLMGSIEYKLLKMLCGPGKVALLFGKRGAGKTSLLSYMIQRLSSLSNAYFLTNQIFFPNPKYDDLFRHRHAHPSDDHSSTVACRPNCSRIVDFPKINVVSNTYESLAITSEIRSRWIHSLNPTDRKRYFANQPIDSEPWIVFFLDEATNFMSKMRAMADDALVMNSWVDMCRKLGIGLVFVYHDLNEPICCTRRARLH